MALTADPGVRALTALALLLPLAAPAAAQQVPVTQPGPSTDWPHYAGDQGTQRYAPLPALTRDNFGSLVFAWLSNSPDERIPGAGSDELWAGKHESTPIMADGVLYNSTSFSQAYALDAATGGNALGSRPRKLPGRHAAEFRLHQSRSGAVVRRRHAADLPRDRRQPPDRSQRRRRAADRKLGRSRRSQPA